MIYPAATVGGRFWGYYCTLSASRKHYRHLVLEFPWVPSEAFRKEFLYPLFWNQLLSMIDLVCHCISVDIRGPDEITASVFSNVYSVPVRVIDVGSGDLKTFGFDVLVNGIEYRAWSKAPTSLNHVVKLV